MSPQRDQQLQSHRERSSQYNLELGSASAPSIVFRESVLQYTDVPWDTDIPWDKRDFRAQIFF